MVFRRSFSQPGAVRLHSSVLDQPKLRASTVFLIAFRFFMRVAVRWVDSQDVVDVKPALRCSETANANCHAHSHRDRDANGDAWWPSHSVTAASSNAGAPPVRGTGDS